MNLKYFLLIIILRFALRTNFANPILPETKNETLVNSEPKPEPKPESKADPKPDPKQDPKTHPKTDPKTDPKSDTKTEPKPQHDIGFFAQITDVHYDPDYDRNGDPNHLCRRSNGKKKNKSKKKLLGKFGMFGCESPLILVKSAVDAMHKMVPNPDFILWTGDSVTHKIAYGNLEKITDIITNVTNVIVDKYPTTPLFPSFGNHDYYPEDDLPPSENFVYNAMYKLWGKWTGNAVSMKSAGYYSVPLSPTLRLLVLNDILWYSHNGLDLGDDPGKQFEWIENSLDTARVQNQRVLIGAHIAPDAWRYSLEIEYKKRLLGILRNNSDVVSSLVMGHRHEDNWRILYDEDQKVPLVPMFIAPSVTPKDDTNPAFRIYKYAKTTGTILDYYQYFLDLETANAHGKAAWNFEYQFTKSYNVSSASLDDLATVFNRIGAESHLRRKYNLYANVMSRRTRCANNCRLEKWCEIINFTSADVKSCLKRKKHPSKKHHRISARKPEPKDKKEKKSD